MEYSCFGTDNSRAKLNIEVGQKWSSFKMQNNLLNSIFLKIDNGDGIVQENEYLLLDKLLSIADSLVKKDNQISSEELQKLSEKLKNNELNIEDLKMESMVTVNPKEYELDSLKQRYPESRYKIKERMGSIEIFDIKTNKKVLMVNSDKYGFYITDYDKNEKESFFRNYSKNGVLNFYDKKGDVRRYPIAEYIHNDVCAKNRFGLPTTGKDIEKHVKMLDSNNIITIMENYKEKYGEDLVEAIEDEIGLDKNVKNRLLKHIQKCLENFYGYKKDFANNNSQVSNKWHKGDSYSIVNRNDILTVKNKKTGKERTIDLNKLVEDLDYRGRAAVKAGLIKLPGEVLMDLAVEGVGLKKTNWLDRLSAREQVAAFYRTTSNNITLGVQKDEFDISRVFVHELEHAVDFKGYILNRATSSNSKRFLETYNREKAKFEKSGGDVHDWDDRAIFGNTYVRKDGGKNISNYATENEVECFAEIYQLITTGECDSQDMLEDFFPETIRLAEQLLAEIRNQPDNVRDCL